jgi:hypothetical protein
MKRRVREITKSLKALLLSGRGGRRGLCAITHQLRVIAANVKATGHVVEVLSTVHYLIRDHRGSSGRGNRVSEHSIVIGGGGLFGGVHIRLFLRLGNVFLVANPFVAEPIGHLGDGDLALTCQVFLHFLARVRIAQVRIEIFIEHFRRLLAEVASFPSETDDSVVGVFLSTLTWHPENVSVRPLRFHTWTVSTALVFPRTFSV